MKKIAVIASIALLLTAVSCKSFLLNKYSKSKDKFNHKEFPAFYVQDQEQLVYDILSDSSKVTMINFWGTWCPPCVAELPEINKLVTNLEAESDIQIVNVCVDCPVEEWKMLKEEHQLLGLNLIADSTSSRQIRLWSEGEGFPFNIVLNNDKKVVASNVLEHGDAQLLTLYTLINATENWTGSQSYRDFFATFNAKKKASTQNNDRFWSFIEKYATNYQ